ncbi:hypothetical protein KKC16_00775 [Patescibacteria group bacterium]|nr:hypothetical protein [Patescibacteria group bacterium]
MQQDNLKKFKELPDSIKKKISESNRMNILNDFEKKYNLELAMYVVRVFVNDIKLADLSNVLVKEKNIKIEQAKKNKR